MFKYTHLKMNLSALSPLPQSIQSRNLVSNFMSCDAITISCNGGTKAQFSGRPKLWSIMSALSVEGLLPRSHINGSPRRFYYGLNLTVDPGNANFRSLIRVHYIRMIKYNYVWVRMQYGKLRANTDCHEWCRIVSVAYPASSPWMCDLDITTENNNGLPIPLMRYLYIILIFRILA